MSDIVIYEDGNVELKATLENETVWLRQNQIAEIFEKDRTVITRHINNILKEQEVDEKSNVQKMHIPNSDKPVKIYSLDIILAVGYRTNSPKAMKFRQWSSKILKEYIIKGYALNHKKLQEQKLDDLNKTLALIKQGLANQELTLYEAKGFVEIVGEYAKSWALLQGYDEQSLQEIIQTRDRNLTLNYNFNYKNAS